MCDQIRFFAGAARMLEGKSAGEYMTGYTSYVRREPIGVCGAVTPWNYPAMMAVWKWAPALAAGNTMVLKPSDTTPASTVWMAEVMAEFLETSLTAYKDWEARKRFPHEKTRIRVAEKLNLDQEDIWPHLKEEPREQQGKTALS